MRKVRSGYRYYSPETGRFLSRDPKNEPGFQNIATYPRTEDDELIALLSELLADMQGTDPTAAAVLRRVMFALQMDMHSHSGMDTLYGFVRNAPVNLIDPFGLKWWWPPDWFKDKDEDKCCDVEAEKELIKEAISKLKDQAEKLPGKAGQIAKMISILEKLLDSGEHCKGVIDGWESCEDYISDPTDPAACYNCCMLLQPNKGVGHFVCTGACGVVLE